MDPTPTPHTGTSLLASFIAGAIGALVVLLVFTANPAWRARLLPAGEAPTAREEAARQDVPDAHTTQEALVIDTVKTVSPAVVSIVITKDVPVVEQFFGSPFGNFGPFNFQVPQLRQRGTERREVGGGSGFLVSADGLVVTNRHVVSDTSADYTVFTADGTKYEAEVVARDPVNDIAVLRVAGSNFPFLEFGDSDALQVGASVIAIGNALSEFQNSVSVGVISGLSRSIIAGDGSGAAESLDQVIQTDAAINPGNSGGPLLSLGGKVIGVNVAVAAGSENIGFALPANMVKSVVASVVEHGRIIRPYLGVRYTEITPIIQEQNDLPVDYGVLVVSGETADEPAVVSGSPAARAGVTEGDIILEIDSTRLDENTSLAQYIRTKNVGDTVTLTILRNGAEQTMQVTLAEVPQE